MDQVINNKHLTEQWDEHQPPPTYEILHDEAEEGGEEVGDSDGEGAVSGRYHGVSSGVLNIHMETEVNQGSIIHDSEWNKQKRPLYEYKYYCRTVYLEMLSL